MLSWFIQIIYLVVLSIFVVIFLFISGSFERPGPNFVFGLGGFSLILPTIFLMPGRFHFLIQKGLSLIQGLIPAHRGKQNITASKRPLHE